MKKHILLSLLLTLGAIASDQTYMTQEEYRAQMKNKYGDGASENRYQQQKQYRYGENSANGEGKQMRKRDGSGGGQHKGGGRGKR